MRRNPHSCSSLKRRAPILLAESAHGAEVCQRTLDKKSFCQRRKRCHGVYRDRITVVRDRGTEPCGIPLLRVANNEGLLLLSSTSCSLFERYDATYLLTELDSLVSQSFGRRCIWQTHSGPKRVETGQNRCWTEKSSKIISGLDQSPYSLLQVTVVKS